MRRSAAEATILDVSRKKAPLEVVRVVRAHTVDDRARDLAEAKRDADRARAAADDAKDCAARARDDLRAQTERETQELSGGASARDFAQLAAFEVGAQQVIERADDRARAAERRADEATRLEGARRGALGEARAALDVVEKHQANARARDEREAAARLDEAAEDAFAARFRVRT